MKKSAIALAVAGALAGSSALVASAPALADTILYGSARVSVDYNSRDIFPLFDNDDREQSNWDLFNNSSRLGVRGSEDLGGGLSAIYQMEFGVDLTEGGQFRQNRPKLVGLKHDQFGTLSFGTQWTPYYNVVGVSDVFNSGKSFSSGQYIGLIRVDNTVVYNSPSFYGLRFEGMVDLNGVDGGDNLFGNTSDDADFYNGSLIYQNGPFFLGGTYAALGGDTVPGPGFVAGDRDLIGAGAGFKWGPLGFTATYEYGDLFNRQGDITDNIVTTGNNSDYYGTLSYTFGSNIIRAGGGKTRFTPQGQERFWVDNYLLGYQHNLSKRTRVWAEYLRRDPDDNGQDVFAKRDVVSLGLRHDF